MKYPKIGIKTTDKLIIKPALEAEVYFNPNVIVINTNNKIILKRAEHITSSFFIGNILFLKKTKVTTKESANL